MAVQIPTCRIIAADNDRPGRCRRVNILTALPNNHANQFKQYQQATVPRSKTSTLSLWSRRLAAPRVSPVRALT